MNYSNWKSLSTYSRIVIVSWDEKQKTRLKNVSKLAYNMVVLETMGLTLLIVDSFDKTSTK